MSSFEKAFKILDILAPFGESYLVGGCVRDKWLDIVPNDIDIATNVSMEKIEELFSTYDIGKNKDFGIVVVKFENESFEIAQFRTESDYADGRHPDKINFVKTIEEDLSRRDFTINAMAVDKYGNIIDPYGGKFDLWEKSLNTVESADISFSSDFLRILRAIRFKNKFDLTYSDEVKKQITLNGHKLLNLPKERIHDELWKMASLSGVKFSNCIQDMFYLGILQYVYPEIYNLSKFEHSPEHHPEGRYIIQHIFACLKAYNGNDPFVNFSILFHDVGKSLVYSYDTEKMKHHYYSHDVKGSDLIKNEISEKYKWSNTLKDIVAFCTEKHMLFHNFGKMKTSKICKLLIDPNWDILYLVSKADEFSRGKVLGEIGWNKVDNKLKEIKESGFTIERIKEIRSAINGNLIMEIRNIKNPCKEVGDFIDKTVAYVINHNISLDNKDKISQYVKSLKFPNWCELKERLKKNEKIN